MHNISDILVEDNNASIRSELRSKTRKKYGGWRWRHISHALFELESAITGDMTAYHGDGYKYRETRYTDEELMRKKLFVDKVNYARDMLLYSAANTFYLGGYFRGYTFNAGGTPHYTTGHPTWEQFKEEAREFLIDLNNNTLTVDKLLVEFNKKYNANIGGVITDPTDPLTGTRYWTSCDHDGNIIYTSIPENTTIDFSKNGMVALDEIVFFLSKIDAIFYMYWMTSFNHDNVLTVGGSATEQSSASEAFNHRNDNYYEYNYASSSGYTLIDHYSHPGKPEEIYWSYNYRRSDLVLDQYPRPLTNTILKGKHGAWLACRAYHGFLDFTWDAQGLPIAENAYVFSFDFAPLTPDRDAYRSYSPNPPYLPSTIDITVGYEVLRIIHVCKDMVFATHDALDSDDKYVESCPYCMQPNIVYNNGTLANYSHVIKPYGYTGWGEPYKIVVDSYKYKSIKTRFANHKDTSTTVGCTITPTIDGHLVTEPITYTIENIALDEDTVPKMNFNYPYAVIYSTVFRPAPAVDYIYGRIDFRVEPSELQYHPYSRKDSEPFDVVISSYKNMGRIKYKVTNIEGLKVKLDKLEDDVAYTGKPIESVIHVTPPKNLAQGYYTSSIILDVTGVASLNPYIWISWSIQ